jgi:hypothetical protein
MRDCEGLNQFPDFQRRRSDHQLFLWPTLIADLRQRLVETYGVNTDYRVTSVKLTPASGPALINEL